uniref:NADH dehydrogenase subunit 6 n=1 Tax=Perenniporia fraxinea TaxID=1350006 RepID=UPI0028E09F65|nr:NADH dehydrogenase subunit 6 [Perenniporia fraxinea]WFS78697.1 NADH dehydrogenase subunit 6 [Perenniporia fraxinea]
MKNFLIDLLAFAALFSSVLVITSKNPVIAVIFLISVFVNAAGYLILLGIGFIGISYIIVYIGAIAVLFLFVIMLLNIRLSEILETSHQYTKNLPLALFIGSLFLYEIYTIIPFPVNNVSFTSIFLNLINNLNELLLKNNLNLDNGVFISINPGIADTTLINFSQIESVGYGLYTYGGVWLIIVSIILLLAMISPIFITRPKTKTSTQDNSPYHPVALAYGLRLEGLDRNKTGGKRYYHSSPIVKSALQPLSIKLNPWLVTGFTDAEGCFSARLHNYKETKFFIGPIFTFHMHINYLEILLSLKDFFGVGSIRTDKTGAHYQVTGLDNL